MTKVSLLFLKRAASRKTYIVQRAAAVVNDNHRQHGGERNEDNIDRKVAREKRVLEHIVDGDEIRDNVDDFQQQPEGQRNAARAE